MKKPVRGGAWVSYEEERHTRFSFASIKSAVKSEKARWRGRWGTILGGFFLCEPERAAPSPGRPGYSGYMAVTWRLHAGRGISWKQTKRSMEQMGVTDCSICRICGEKLKPPPPFSSSERSTSEKKCNTVTTFGKRRKSES